MTGTVAVRELSPAAWPAFGSRVAGLERGVVYPLGEDWFEIDHGGDYFAFFSRLGVLSYFVALEGDEVVGVLAAVLRELPEQAWYFCDLKVRPGHGASRAAARLLHAFAGKSAPCPRAYGISMNPGDGSPNRLVRVAGRLRGAPFALATTLRLYSLDARAMAAVAPDLAGVRGPLTYLSLRGVKDIVLRSTGQPMPLLHVQFGPAAETGVAEPQAGHVHMFCLPEDDALNARLGEVGHAPTATASVVQRGMPGRDWGFVLTSDI